MDPTPYLAAHVPHFLAILVAVTLLDVVVAAIPDRILPAGSTAQAAVLVARAVLGALLGLVRKAPPAALVLALLLASTPAHADDPPAAPVRAPVSLPAPPAPEVSMPPPTTSTPPTFADVAACTVASLPGTIGRCVSQPQAVPPMDSRAFWMAFGGSLGTTAVAVIGALVTHYLPPEPMR